MKVWFRGVLLALERIAVALGGLLDAVHALRTGSSVEAEFESRVASLERELERRHAEAEGLLLKASGKFDAARAAEERARRLAERSEAGPDEQLEALQQAYASLGVPLDYGVGVEENGVPRLPSSLEGRHSSKQNAYTMKFRGPR